ncbi:MAG TPA: autoinducer binding domain-containing protein [Paracoccaceae bacterium]|nr:autoinducer binding domain-containing protein [Paracoccaceae bacterium]HMO71415.1 autoinducer binding domain-containing protein [Paracoccaceae bacterium]
MPSTGSGQRGGPAGEWGERVTSEVLEVLGRIAAAQRIPEAWQHAAAFFGPLGFGRLNYGLTRLRTETSVGDPADALFLSTAEPEYARLYVRDGFFKRAPVYRWAVSNTGMRTWRWVHDDFAAGRLAPEEAEAVRVNARFGIFAGVSISFPDTQRTKGALGMTADIGMDHDDVDAILDRHRSAIEAVAHMMHLRIITLPASYVRRSLTPRQREVLEWVADGKTVQDIAMLMSISAAMVEKHLRLAREALNTETTAQAVAKGTLLNLIFTRDAPAPAPARSGMDSPTYAVEAVAAW